MRRAGRLPVRRRAWASIGIHRSVGVGSANPIIIWRRRFARPFDIVPRSRTGEARGAAMKFSAWTAALALLAGCNAGVTQAPLPARAGGAGAPAPRAGLWRGERGRRRQGAGRA